MNISKYYSLLVITPLELEIKYLKRKINKKFNLTKELDKKYLLLLQKQLQNSYKTFYNFNK